MYVIVEKNKAFLSTPETQPVILADLQLPVSLEQSHHDWEQARQSVLCKSSTYEVIAAVPSDASLLVTFDAATHLEPLQVLNYMSLPVLPGSLYVDIPYVPSIATQRPPQTGADPDSDMEPDLSIDIPADPALFESLTETENKNRQEKKEKTHKKKEEAEPKKTEEAPKKKEDLLVEKKRALQKDTERGSRKKETLESKKKVEETKKNEELRKRREEMRDFAAKGKVDRDPVSKTPGSSTERRHTSPRRASRRSTWEWREFLDYRRRTAATCPPLKKYRK